MQRKKQVNATWVSITPGWENQYLSQVQQNSGTIESGSAKTLKTAMQAKTCETKITQVWTKPSWMDVDCHAMKQEAHGDQKECLWYFSLVGLVT